MKGRDFYIHYIEKNKEGESTQNEACKELWSTSKALVMTIDRFSSDAVKNRATAKALLDVITETMSDEFLPLLVIMTLIL